MRCDTLCGLRIPTPVSWDGLEECVRTGGDWRRLDQLPSRLAEK